MFSPGVKSIYALDSTVVVGRTFGQTVEPILRAFTTVLGRFPLVLQTFYCVVSDGYCQYCVDVVRGFRQGPSGEDRLRDDVSFAFEQQDGVIALEPVDDTRVGFVHP